MLTPKGLGLAKKKKYTKFKRRASLIGYQHEVFYD